MPFAIKQFNLRDYDIVVSFSYAVAHGTQNFNGARHISYTFTPMRYAWLDLNLNGTRTRKNLILDRFMSSFCEWDKKAAARVHQKHRGLHTHRRVLEAGEHEHGASVHFVTRELDGGPVVIQARVPVRNDDDEASLAARVLAEEHRIYPECIHWFATGRLQWRDGVVLLDGRPLTTPIVRQSGDVAAA